MMKSILFVGAMVGACGGVSLAQAPTQAPPAPGALGMYAYPLEQQDAVEQGTDQTECWEWATNQTGVDPLAPVGQPGATPPPPVASPGAGAVRGAARGAAGGAIIGGIAGNAGRGAAIGSVVGGVRGHRATRYANTLAQEQHTQQQAAGANAQVETFKKAYGACLSGRGYSVR